MSSLATSAWWTSYYAQHQTDPIEWYLPTDVALDTTHAIIQRHFSHRSIPQSLRLLHIGCGSSRLADELYSAYGYSAVDNVDFAESIIEQMKRDTQSARPPTITYAAMDCRSMTLPPATYDVVLDKGTLDCLALDEQQTDSVQRTAHNVHRILKTNGIFISFSIHEAQQQRIQQLAGRDPSTDDGRSAADTPELLDWNIECIVMNQRPLELPAQEHTYCYVCRK